MLKITKSQIVKGQKVVVGDLNKPSELTVEKVSGGMVYFTNPNVIKISNSILG